MQHMIQRLPGFLWAPDFSCDIFDIAGMDHSIKEWIGMDRGPALIPFMLTRSQLQNVSAFYCDPSIEGGFHDIGIYWGYPHRWSIIYNRKSLDDD